MTCSRSKRPRQTADGRDDGDARSVEKAVRCCCCILKTRRQPARLESMAVVSDNREWYGNECNRDYVIEFTTPNFGVPAFQNRNPAYQNITCKVPEGRYQSVRSSVYFSMSHK